MNWLSIVIIAHLIFAIVYVIDKIVISKIKLEPIVYAFYVGLLSAFVLVLIPFGFELLSVAYITISLIAGVLFILGVLLVYNAFRSNDVSEIAPIFGAAVPIFTLLLALLFLGERLTLVELIAFVLLIIGGMVMMSNNNYHTKKKMFLERGGIVAIGGAFLIAISYVLSKMVFQQYSFIGAFIWIRLGSVVGALLLLVKSDNRQLIFRKVHKLKFSTAGLISFNKLLSAGAFILLNYAIYLGSVSLVNALQGVQYVFLLLIAIMLSRKFPQVLKEELNSKIVVRKIIAIILIGLGLSLLVL